MQIEKASLLPLINLSHLKSSITPLYKLNMPLKRVLPFLILLLGFALSQSDQSTTRPNIILLLTDDQDLHLDSLNYMPLLKKHLLNQGTFYTKHYCTIALCCPARVTLWTGKAAHNTVRSVGGS
jgi:hypothetical protein